MYSFLNFKKRQMLMFLVNVLRVRYKLNSGIIVQYRVVHDKKISVARENTQNFAILRVCLNYVRRLKII